jgi:hypothetical protein
VTRGRRKEGGDGGADRWDCSVGEREWAWVAGLRGAWGNGPSGAGHGERRSGPPRGRCGPRAGEGGPVGEGKREREEWAKHGEGEERERRWSAGWAIGPAWAGLLFSFPDFPFSFPFSNQLKSS